LLQATGETSGAGARSDSSTQPLFDWHEPSARKHTPPRRSLIGIAPAATFARLHEVATAKLLPAAARRTEGCGAAEIGCLETDRGRHVFAVLLIGCCIVGGMAIGLSIDTSGAERSGGGERLGALSPADCAAPHAAAALPICRECTCCSNVASGPASRLRCPACVQCCAHCPNCQSLPAEQASCIDSGGKVADFKGKGRGWFCVPAAFEPGGGKYPEWFSSVLDVNAQWRLCPAAELPTCEQLGCNPLPANATLVVPPVRAPVINAAPALAEPAGTTRAYATSRGG
jgi:hypothetical protein